MSGFIRGRSRARVAVANPGGGGQPPTSKTGWRSCHKPNGAAGPSCSPEFAGLCPKRFTNVTNGVTPRRLDRRGNLPLSGTARLRRSAPTGAVESGRNCSAWRSFADDASSWERCIRARPGKQRLANTIHQGGPGGVGGSLPPVRVRYERITNTIAPAPGRPADRRALPAALRNG